MEIEIVRNDFNYLIKHEKIVWTAYLKSVVTVPIIFIITGAFFFLDSVDVYKKTGSLISLSFSLSIGFFVGTLSIVVNHFYQRYIGIKKIKEHALLMKKNNDNLTINITGWGIISRSHTVTTEYSWGFFQTFQILDEHLFLIPKYPRYEKIVIRKSELPIEHYETLVDFLSKRFNVTGYIK